MGFFDNLFNGSSDPRRSAQIRGGMLGAAQALLRPYSGFGDALTGAGLGAQQGKQDYLTDQFHELRTQQMEGELRRSAAQQAALNNLFMGTKSPVAGAPGQDPSMAAAMEPTSQLPTGPQMKLPPGFDSPEQFQQYAAVDPEGAIKRMFPEQQKPIAGNPGQVFIDPVTHQEVFSIPDRAKAPEHTGGMYWAGPEKGFQPIPGYEDQQRRIAAAGRAPRESVWRELTPEEKKARNLPKDAAYQYNDQTGKIERVAGNPSVRPIPASALAGIQSNQRTLTKIDKAIAALGGSDPIEGVDVRPDAIGGKTYLGDFITQRMDPAGVSTRALIADIGSQKLHDRSGAAVTLSEAPRLQPFIPSVHDTPQAALDKLRNLRAEYAANVDETQAFYSPEAGYMSLPPPATNTPAVNPQSQTQPANLPKIDLSEKNISAAALKSGKTVKQIKDDLRAKGYKVP